jgi:GH43 family beta-xylosidase
MTLPVYQNPIVPNRADPFITRVDGHYWFTASVPEYDRIELRGSGTIRGLAGAEPRIVWRRHESGPMSANIWAPEIHRVGGKWYIYFAAGRADDIFRIRSHVLENPAEDPSTGAWTEKGELNTPWDSFNLDATSFIHRGRQYLVWAQKDPAIQGNSNIYLAPMDNPWTIGARPVMLSRPDRDWERHGFWVNEGPAVLVRHGRVFISYSASATDANYCLGLLSASLDADLMDPASWTKADAPVFATDEANGQYGPGHNSFTVAEDGTSDLLVYHARNYREIAGDPLWNPDRHTRVQPFGWKPDGSPDFGRPVADALRGVPYPSAGSVP